MLCVGLLWASLAAALLLAACLRARGPPPPSPPPPPPSPSPSRAAPAPPSVGLGPPSPSSPAASSCPTPTTSSLATPRASIYVGACWAHWDKLQCFLVPSLLIWGLDRGARLVRAALLHYHPWASSGLMPSFVPARAAMTLFSGHHDGEIVRLDLDNDQDLWAVGQHFYLCFPESSLWQSHPLTPLNVPLVRDGRVRHSYIVRAKSGETRELARLAVRKQTVDEAAKGSCVPTTSFVLTGPYGDNLLDRLESCADNVVCVAGGMGITYVLPVLLQLARQRPVPDRRVELIWAMRHLDNLDWVREEMDSLQRSQAALNLKIRLFATRDSDSSAASAATDPSSSSDKACGCPDDLSVHCIGAKDGSRHPDLRRLLGDFVESTAAGRTTVFASGPGAMITDLRAVVASLNSPSKVWRREERFDVDLVCDDRLEW